MSLENCPIYRVWRAAVSSVLIGLGKRHTYFRADGFLKISFAPFDAVTLLYLGKNCNIFYYGP